MQSQFILTKTISINAPKSKVWDALTNPDIIKQYFFGTECDTDWKKGSPIYFRGSWEGKAYEDKGKILDVNPGNFVVYNYWSSFSGTEDIPENYSDIRYELEDDGKGTKLTIIQNGFKTEEARNHSDTNWGMIMEGMKKLIEV